MLNILKEIENNFKNIILNNVDNFKSMYIDYEHPYVSRIWFPYKEYRVLLHKIEECETIDALYHPHPWESAVRIIKGSYEMGVGYSETNDKPLTSCKLILPQNSMYEMIEKDGWHYVRPLETVYSLMVTGKLYNRSIPLEPNKKFRELTTNEINIDMLPIFLEYYEK